MLFIIRLLSLFLCTQFFVDYAGSANVIYNTIMHEIIHTLGFSSRLYEQYVAKTVQLWYYAYYNVLVLLLILVLIIIQQRQ